MALRVSPGRVRDVRFAEQWRGYRTDEVDEFVEQVADSFDHFERRLEEAAQRTAMAEQRLEERGPDEELRRTLVLAQRTADAALEEARAQAARIVADAEAQARSILDGLEERRARLEAEIDARKDAELAEVNERRAALETDVELLSSYVEHHRTRLVDELRSHLAWLEGAGNLDPLPSPGPAPGSPPPGDGLSAAPLPESPTPSGAAETPLAATAASAVGDTQKEATPEPPAPPLETAEDQGAGDADGPTGSPAKVSDDRDAPDETALDDLDVIPWRESSGHAAAPQAGPGVTDEEDDPFLAELRRAVDDPEPLGPRDEPVAWEGDVDLYDRQGPGSMRSRRHRRS